MANSALTRARNFDGTGRMALLRRVLITQGLVLGVAAAMLAGLAVPTIYIPYSKIERSGMAANTASPALVVSAETETRNRKIH